MPERRVREVFSSADLEVLAIESREIACRRTSNGGLAIVSLVPSAVVITTATETRAVDPHGNPLDLAALRQAIPELDRRMNCNHRNLR
jgi:hypothetical protein